MTNHRKRKIPSALCLGGNQDDNRDKIALNNETTFKDRDCQLLLAEHDRSQSSLRNDVQLSTDDAAFDDMYKYLKSNTTTLDNHKESKVASFYSQRSVFITGASGFIGKVS